MLFKLNQLGQTTWSYMYWRNKVERGNYSCTLFSVDSYTRNVYVEPKGNGNYLTEAFEELNATMEKDEKTLEIEKLKLELGQMKSRLEGTEKELEVNNYIMKFPFLSLEMQSRRYEKKIS